MKTAPDFDRLALALCDRLLGRPPLAEDLGPGPLRTGGAQQLADELRRVWNARGAADLAELEMELSTLMGATMAGPYVKNLQRALRALDR